MFDFGLFTTSVSLGWFIILMAICVAVFIFGGPATGLVLTAVVLYNVTIWQPLFDGQKTLFWLAVIVAVIAIIWYFLSGGRSGGGLAVVAAVVALIMVLVLMLGHLFGAFERGDIDDPDAPEVATTYDDIMEDMDDMRQKRVDAENSIREDFGGDIRGLKTRVNRQAERIDSLEASADRQRGRLERLRQMLDGHIEEHVKRSHRGSK